MLRNLAFAIRFYSFQFFGGLIAFIVGSYGLLLPSLDDASLAFQAPNYHLIWLCITALGFIFFVNAFNKARKYRAEISARVLSEI